MPPITVNDLPRRVAAAQRVLHTITAGRAARCAVCHRRIGPDEAARHANGARVHIRCAPAREG